MKRIFLCSRFSKVRKLFEVKAGVLTGKKAAHICTAAKGEWFGFLSDFGKTAIKSTGLDVRRLDVSAASYHKIKEILRDSDYIYVSGGNTFFLLQELKRTGADKILLEEINKGKFYIGESAGAVIAAHDIGYIKEMDNQKKGSSLKDFKGLGITDFYTLPHYENPRFKKAAERIIRKYSARIDLKAISDRQAIFAEDDKIDILNSGQYHQA